MRRLLLEAGFWETRQWVSWASCFGHWTMDWWYPEVRLTEASNRENVFQTWDVYCGYQSDTTSWQNSWDRTIYAVSLVKGNFRGRGIKWTILENLSTIVALPSEGDWDPVTKHPGRYLTRGNEEKGTREEGLEGNDNKQPVWRAASSTWILAIACLQPPM